MKPGIKLPLGPQACPFCDSDDVALGAMHVHDKDIWMIRCNDCSATVTSTESHDAVVLAWNRRPGGRP